MANVKKMDCVILGLLSHQQMTGYEIKKRMDMQLKFFWGASFGSIYPTLNALEKDGLVTKTEVKENGRDKVVYEITVSGHERLKAWLNMPVEKDELRYETLLKLFFGGEIGAMGTLNHIEAFEAKIKEELPFLKAAVSQLQELQEEEDHTYFMLTAMFGVKTYEAYLSWCKEAKKILHKKSR